MCRITKQQKRRKDFLEVVKLFFIQHRAFIDKADVQRFLATFPAGDEITAPQSGGGEGSRHRFVDLIGRKCTVQCNFGQTFDIGFVALPCQPLGDLFIFGIVDGRIKDTVDRGRGHAVIAQDTCGLVGGSKNGQRASILAFAAFPIAGNDINTCILQRMIKSGQQHRLARSGLADHGHHRGAIRLRRLQQAVTKINAGLAQSRRDIIPGFGLILGKCNGRCIHAATVS